MIKKNVDFERASDVQAIVYSVKDGSAVFVVPNGFVLLEVPLSQTRFRTTQTNFVLNVIVDLSQVRSCAKELIF